MGWGSLKWDDGMMKEQNNPTEEEYTE